MLTATTSETLLRPRIAPLPGQLPAAPTPAAQMAPLPAPQTAPAAPAAQMMPVLPPQMAPAPAPGGAATATPYGGGLTTEFAAPGATPVPLPPPTMAPPASPIGPVTSFGPGNDLRGSQINPMTDPRTQGTQGQVDTAAGKVSQGPDLRQAGSDIYQSLLEQALPSFQAAGRGILQNAAAGGRLGSGMTEEELTTDPFGSSGLGLQLGKYRTQLAQQLAGTLAPAEAQNRLANLGALSGLESQQFGQGAQQRGELRGERGYQTEQANTALQNRINQQVLQDQLLNSAYGRSAGAAGLGLEGAQQFGQEGIANQGAAAGALGSLEQQDLWNQYFANRPGAGTTPGAGAAPGGGGPHPDGPSGIPGLVWKNGQLVPEFH